MIVRSLLLATALLAATRRGGTRAGERRRHRGAGAARQRHRLRRRGADRRRHRQCRHRGADRDLSRARSRHHRLAADRAGAGRAAGASGDRRRHQGHQGGLGDPAVAPARRPRRSNFRSPARWNIAAASAMPPISSLTFDRDVQDIQLDASVHRRDAADRGPLRAAQRPLRCQLRDRQRQQRARRPSCALPASRSKPWKPPC